MDNLIYMNESVIDDSLKCEICKKPFSDPVSLPCDQSFCRQCIEQNIPNHLDNCSQCNEKTVSINNLKTEGPLIQKLLDNIKVRCQRCSEDNIKRGDFLKHTKESCPKRSISCSAHDIKCAWNGAYDQLDEHRRVCSYDHIRPVLTELIENNQRLQQFEGKSKEQDERIIQLQNENQTLNGKLVQIKQLESETKLLKEKVDDQTNEITQLTQQNQTLNEQITEMKPPGIDIPDLIAKSTTQSNEINQLKNDNQSLNEKLNQQQIENKDLNEKLQVQIDEVNRLKTDYQTIQDQCQQNKTKIDQDALALTNFNQLSEENSKKFNLLQADNQNLTQLLQSQETQMETLDKQKQESIDREKQTQLEKEQLIQQINQEIDRYKKIELEKDQAIQHLTGQLDYARQIQLQNEQLTQQLNQEKDHSKEIQIKNEQLTQQLNQEKDHSKQVQMKNEQLTKRIMQDKIQIEQLHIHIKRSEAELNKPIITWNKLTGNYRNDKLEQLIDICEINSLINLNGEKINDNDLDIVIYKGLIHKQCHSITFSDNCLLTDSIIKLSFALKTNQTLTKLVISNNILSLIAIKHLSESLSFDNSTLKCLILSSNQIDDDSLFYLSNMLKANQTLISIGLQDNHLTDKSIQYLAEILQCYNQTIQEISLHSNKFITDLSVDHICNMITKNPSLQALWIWDCQLSKEGTDKLQQSIQTKVNFDLKL